jgi:thioredoxin-like negative regulator of GroEL
MAKLLSWTEPIDRLHAERHFARFVRNASRKRHGPESNVEATTFVASSQRPKRKANDATTTINHAASQPDIDEVRTRRLLGQNELDACLTDEARRRLVVEMSALYTHGHVDDVASELERVRSLHPADVELHGALADFFLERGDLVRAVEMLFHLVDGYFEKADANAARRCLERIQALDPENRRLQRFEKLLAAR